MVTLQRVLCLSLSSKLRKTQRAIEAATKRQQAVVEKSAVVSSVQREEEERGDQPIWPERRVIISLQRSPNNTHDVTRVICCLHVDRYNKNHSAFNVTLCLSPVSLFLCNHVAVCHTLSQCTGCLLLLDQSKQAPLLSPRDLFPLSAALNSLSLSLSAHASHVSVLANALVRSSWRAVCWNCCGLETYAAICCGLRLAVPVWSTLCPRLLYTLGCERCDGPAAAAVGISQYSSAHTYRGTRGGKEKIDSEERERMERCKEKEREGKRRRNGKEKGSPPEQPAGVHGKVIR